MDCSGPGIVRRRHGRGFAYVGEDGRRVGDAEVIDRIAKLAILPAWRDVWICPDPMGHLQATGVDAAGRKLALAMRTSPPSCAAMGNASDCASCPSSELTSWPTFPALTYSGSSVSGRQRA